MSRKRIVAFFLTACFLLLTFAACSNTPAASTADPAASTADPAVPSGGDGAPVKDTAVVIGSAEPDCFLPFHSTITTGADELPILHNIYEGLIKLGTDRSHIPLLATDWEMSEDGLSYTFYLRDDVYFHNGYKMTAEDVEWSLNTACPSMQGSAQFANYDYAEALDDTTVVVHLKSPYAPFLNAMCARYGLIASKQLMEEIGEDAYNENPVGTGPYKWVSRVPGDRITMVANEDHWKGAPAIKNVVYRVMTDSNTQMISMESGDADAWIFANLGAVMRADPAKVTYATCDASLFSALTFNMNSGPTRDLKFRQALQYGINKEEINIGVFEGQATIGDSPICPIFSSHPTPGQYKVIDYDPEMAKQLLSESSYNGEEFRIITISGSNNERICQILQGQLIALGINATVNAVDAPSHAALENEGEFNASLRASGVSVMDCDGLYNSTYSEYVTVPGTFDTGNWSLECDELLIAARAEVDEEARKALYAQVCDVITDNAWSVTLIYDVNTLAYNPNLKGIAPRPLGSLIYYDEWSW